MRTVRRAALAGAFYPSNAARLSTTVDELMSAVEISGESPPLKAAIVPHPGYADSGAVAASTYARLRAVQDRIRRAVILGPSHFARVNGLAVGKFEAMQTPLGEVSIDVESVKRACELPQVLESAEAHSREHSLEVQLPFLQRALREFTVVPLAVGDADPRTVAEAVLGLLRGQGTGIPR